MSYSKADIPDFLQGVGAQLTDAEQRIDTDTVRIKQDITAVGCRATVA